MASFEYLENPSDLSEPDILFLVIEAPEEQRAKVVRVRETDGLPAVTGPDVESRFGLTERDEADRTTQE